MNKIAIKKIERFKFLQIKKIKILSFPTAKRDWHGNFFPGLSIFFFPSKKLLIYHIEEYLVREIKTRTPAISLVSVFMKMSPVCKVFVFWFGFFLYSFWWVKYFILSFFALSRLLLFWLCLGYLSISVQGLGCAVTMGLILM